MLGRFGEINDGHGVAVRQRSYPLTLMVDNAAGESFCKSTSGLSKLRGVYQMRDSRIKELRDAKIVVNS